MDLAEETADMERAEDLFARYRVAFDPQVLAVHRVRILRRFGLWSAALASIRDPGQRDARLAEILAEVYQTCARREGPYADRLRPAPDLVRIRRTHAAGAP